MSENKMMISPKQGVSAGTIARTACLVLALVNQVLAMIGMVPVDIADDTVYQFVSVGATVVTSLVAWWKNNSFSKEAVAADEAMKNAKAAK